MSREPDDELRALVRDEVRSVLLGLATTLGAPSEDYSSRRGHGPPGYERRAWQNIARAIGVRRGRWWHVSREALAAYEARREAPPAPAAVPAPVDTSSAALARRLGLRIVGGNGK
jgi:hypothetical protein